MTNADLSFPRGLTQWALLILLLFLVAQASSLWAQSSYGLGQGVTNQAVNGAGCSTSGTALLKGNGVGGCGSAVAGTDFAPAPPAGTGLLTGNGSGGFNIESLATLSQGGRQCGAPTTFASLPGSPSNGTKCYVTDATMCSAGTAVTVGGGSTFCELTWNGANWMPAGGASGGGTGCMSSGTSILKGNNSGGCTNAVQNTDYFGGEIVLCNNVSGTSGGSFTVYQTKDGHHLKTVAILTNYSNTTSTPQTCSLTANGGSAYTQSAQVQAQTEPYAVVPTGTPPTSLSLPANMGSNPAPITQTFEMGGV